MTAGKCTLNVPTNSNLSRTYSTVPKQPADPHLYQLWTCRLSASPHHHETPSPFFTIRPSSPQSSLRCINPSLLPPACWDLGTRYQHPAIEISHVFFFQSLFAIRKTTDDCGRRFREVATGLLRLRADATRDWRTRETKTRPAPSGPNSFFYVCTQLPNIEKRRLPKLVGVR